MQKFPKNSLVRIAKNLGPSMSHFTSDVDAIVMYTYASEYGGDDYDSYGLHLKSGGSSAWYHENQLTLIKENQEHLLKEWEDEENAIKERQSDLDWIFENGPEVLEKGHGHSVSALFDTLFPGKSMWGASGEGYAYFENGLRTLALAESYLKNKDKKGWLEAISEPKEAE